MKKLVLGVFFLSLFSASPAFAADVVLNLPTDYKATAIVSLGQTTAFTFDFVGNYIVAEDIGIPATKKRPAVNVFRVNKVSPDGKVTSLLDRTGQTITGLSYHQGTVYIVTRGQIYKIAKGKISDVISSLPTDGDYANDNLVFYKGSMYFTTGTATNSGIVGPDNAWLSNYPSNHDVPCSGVKLTGTNVEADNFLSAQKADKAITGAFLPYNTPSTANQMVYGQSKCNGAVIEAHADGTGMQVYAWGLHNPKGLSVNDQGQLWVFDSGMEDRGVRPVKDGKDALYQISKNTWYGWPDFNVGNQIQPALLAEFPNPPPVPDATFALNQLKYLLVSPERFLTNAAVAQASEDKLVQINLGSKNVQDFLSVTGAKIIQYKFGPDDKLYVLVSLADKSTRLYSIENTKAKVAAASVTSSSPKRTTASWSMGGLLALLMSSVGFYVIQSQRPVKPL